MLNEVSQSLGSRREVVDMKRNGGDHIPYRENDDTKPPLSDNNPGEGGKEDSDELQLLEGIHLHIMDQDVGGSPSQQRGHSKLCFQARGEVPE